MAVTIRLQRQGTRNAPFYHIVATDSRNKRDGQCIERIGHYDPSREPSIVELKAERVQHWYGLGAELSTTVKNLLRAKKVEVKRNTKPKKAK
jgi:small subunit ribosomal protein S16